MGLRFQGPSLGNLLQGHDKGSKTSNVAKKWERDVDPSQHSGFHCMPSADYSPCYAGPKSRSPADPGRSARHGPTAPLKVSDLGIKGLWSRV